MRARLQTSVPYQQSLRWDLHRTYYQSRGVQAWVMPEIPYNVTSNPQLARQLAQVVHAGLQASGEGRFRLLEVGAGLGVFALNLLSALETLCRASGEDFGRIEYWLTDFGRDTLVSLAGHPAYRARVEQGVLRFCVLDALQPQQGVDLHGQTLRQGEHAFGVIFAHYVLCALPAAQLYFAQGRFFELHAELWGWLAGGPGQPSQPDQRAAALRQLALRLGQIELVGLSPEHRARLEQARERVMAGMVLPEAARNWAPQHDLRSFLMQSLLRAAGAADMTTEFELAAQIEIRLMTPLFSIETFNQTQLEDVPQLKPIDPARYCASLADAGALEALVAELPEASLTYSQALLDSLRALLSLLSPDGCLMITDKGYAGATEMAGIQPPATSLHSNSLATMVNFPLLVRQLGAQSCGTLWTQEPEALVQTLLISRAAEVPVHLGTAFEAEFITCNDNTVSQLLIEAGVHHGNRDQIPDALRYFLRTLRYRPDDFFVLMNLVNCYRRLNTPEQALPYLARPHDGYFHEPFFAHLKADVYFSLKRYPEALTHYEQALEAAPHNGLLNYHVGLCLSALGRHREALTQLERAQILQPERREIASALQDLRQSGSVARSLQQLHKPHQAPHPFAVQFQRLIQTTG